MILFQEIFYSSSSIMKDDEFSRGTTDMTTASGNLSHNGDAGNSSTKPQSPTLSEMPFTEKLKRKKDFPWKLHKMLEEVEQRGMSGVISWDTDGTSFKVHQPEVFVKDIMPKYFNQTLFRSFQRMVRNQRYRNQTQKFLRWLTVAASNS